MVMRGSTVVGVFDERATAERAIEALYNAGFSSDHIRYSGSSSTSEGGFLASIKHLFSGHDAPSSDAVMGDLTDMGLSPEEAQFYAQEHEAGHTIVSVLANGRGEQALNLLRSNGAYNYDRQGRNVAGTNPNQVTRDTDTTARTTTTGQGVRPQSGTSRPAGNINDEQTRSIKLREEQLQAQKERVQTGEVRVSKDVVTEQQSINVPVSHEEVVIERRPVQGGPVSNTPFGTDETIRIPVNEEQVDVTKNTVVTDEVTVDKREVRETKEFTEPVRHEEIRVDRQGNPIVRGDIEEQDTRGQKGFRTRDTRGQNIPPEAGTRDRSNIQPGTGSGTTQRTNRGPSSGSPNTADQGGMLQETGSRDTFDPNAPKRRTDRTSGDLDPDDERNIDRDNSNPNLRQNPNRRRDINQEDR